MTSSSSTDQHEQREPSPPTVYTVTRGPVQAVECVEHGVVWQAGPGKGRAAESRRVLTAHLEEHQESEPAADQAVTDRRLCVDGLPAGDVLQIRGLIAGLRAGVLTAADVAGCTAAMERDMESGSAHIDEMLEDRGLGRFSSRG